jgi:hypothetical protein
MKPHAMMYGGAIHTLVPATWPAGDHRREWRWRAYVDGNFWRLFKKVSDWRRGVPLYDSHEPIGPYGEATIRAVTWSEFEGRMLLDKLRDTN